MDINTSLSAAQVVIGLIGLLAAGGIATFIIQKKSKRQVQKTGSNSFNIQAGGDVKMSNSDIKAEK